MATIKDVAKLAGVSHGTVSNVLNGKTGVAPEKVRKVLEAVERSGYVPDQTAKNLKTSASKSIAVILPNITDPHFSRVFTGVERIVSEAGYTVALYITGEIPAKEKQILAEVHRNRAAGVILVSCVPEEIDRIARMEEAGIAFVFVERERLSQAGNFVEFDGGELLRNEVLRLLDAGLRDLVLVVGPEDYSSERACEEAFRAAFAERGAEVSDRFIRITNFDRESAFREAIAVFEGSDIPEAVITSSSILMDGVRTAYALTRSLFPIEPAFITLAEDSWTVDPSDGITRLRRPSVNLGERAAELLMEHVREAGFAQRKRIRVEAVRQRPPVRTPVRSLHDEPLRVLMLEGSHARALSALIPDFQSKTGIEVEIATQPYEAMYEAARSSCADGAADVVQIDIPWLPEFARSGLLADLTRSFASDPGAQENFIPGILDAYSRVGGRVYGFPFLFGTQLLFYRKDLFEDEGIRHAYRARYRTELRPPQTWPEFNAVAAFFTRSVNPESPVLFGTTLGARVSSGAVCEFLPRLWGFGGDAFAPDGRIVLDAPESAWALANYAESFKFASSASAEHWWDGQVQEFVRGDAAMMILFVAHATEITNRRTSRVVGRIGYAPVPGGTGLLGGWSLAASAASPNVDRAFEFLSWSTGAEVAIPATVLGGTTSSIGLYKSSELLSVYPWLPKALESFSTSRKRVLPEAFLDAGLTERDFERILGTAVHDCVSGSASPKAALAAAARALREVQLHSSQGGSE